MLIKWVLFLILNTTTTFAHEGGVCVDCQRPEPNVASFIQDSFQNIRKFMCEPKVGKPLSIRDNKELLPRKFRLTKIKEKTFLAEVNLSFLDVRAGHLYSGKTVRDSMINNFVQNNKKFIPAVQSCLDKFAPYLRGPNGETLKIKISNKAPQHIIYIREKNYRPNMNSYPDNITCSTVLHETLHLFGLPDEYKETAKGYIMDKVTGESKFVNEKAEIPAYDCRTVTPSPSVMNDQSEAVKALKLKYLHDVCVCDISKSFSDVVACKENIVKNKAALSKLKSCPPNTKSFQYPSAVETVEDETLELRKPIPLTSNKSLLSPAHFRYITNPNCDFENKSYITCAKHAYESSQNLPTKRCDPEAILCQREMKWLQ